MGPDFKGDLEENYPTSLRDALCQVWSCLRQMPTSCICPYSKILAFQQFLGSSCLGMVDKSVHTATSCWDSLVLSLKIVNWLWNPSTNLLKWTFSTPNTFQLQILTEFMTNQGCQVFPCSFLANFWIFVLE